MTQSLTANTSHYFAAFEHLEGNGFRHDPQWLRQLRRDALDSFLNMGLPTARRGNEEWKYTDLGTLARVPFRLADTSRPKDVIESHLNAFTFGEDHWHRLVFIDGAFKPSLSSQAPPPKGVKITDLAQALRDQGELLEQHLARYADYQDRAFTALNTAFAKEGAFVYIRPGAEVEEPIHLIFLSTAQEESTVSHPRVLALAEEGSSATIVESHGSLSSGAYLSNAVSELVVGPGASVKHYRLQRHGPEAFHVGSTQAVLGRDATFSSMAIDLGGGLVRNNLDVLMAEEGCSCVLNGLYMTTDSQHVDNQVIIDHAKSHTTSRELYKGVLGGKSRTVFHGSIIVRRDAQKVDARQEDKNLLLSNQAEADVKPAFWIYADDVKCGHGAATGRLDEDTLFYLRSRGLDDAAARNLLVKGFVNQVVDSIDCEALKPHLQDLVNRKLEEL
jgi:Fe-S cluster assembly protein SufD